MYVANVKDISPSNPKSVYIGRATQYRPASPLANPFHITADTKEERARVLRQYRVWLWKKIQEGDSAVIDELRRLRAYSVLVCYCHPKPCHGDVIMRAWQWGVRKGWIDPNPYANHDSKLLCNVADEGAAAISEAELKEWRAATVAEITAAAPKKTRKTRKAGVSKTKRDLVAAAASMALIVSSAAGAI